MNQSNDKNLRFGKEKDDLLNSSAIEQLKTTCSMFDKACGKLFGRIEKSQRQVAELNCMKGQIVSKFDKMVSLIGEKNGVSSSFKNQLSKHLPSLESSRNRRNSVQCSPTQAFMMPDEILETDDSPLESKGFKISPKKEETQKFQLRSKMSERADPLSNDQINSSFDMDSRSQIRHLDSIEPTLPSIYAEKPNSPANITTSTWKKQKSFLIKVPEDDKDQFLKVVRSKIGELYTKQAEELYEKFRKNQINYHELKVKFSWAVESFGFDITQVFVNTKAGLEWLANNKDLVRVIGLLDLFHRNILEYMIMKYPPNQNKIVDIQLSRKIKEISKHIDPQYEMLHNAGISFSNKKNNKDFTRQIKLWLNMLTKEVKREFPRFNEKMRSLFLNHDTSLSETDAVQVEYEIGAKISESCPFYTEDELDQPDLNLKNLEVLRVLIKWIEDLMKYFQNPTMKILNNKAGFKSVSHGQTIVLSYKRKQILVQKLDQIFKKNLKKKQDQNHRDMLTIIADLYIMLENGFEGYSEIDEREVKVGKIAQYFSDSAVTYTQKILNGLIFALNSVGEMYCGNSLESELDLVTFGVMDILRCRCVGSKQQIFRIYSQICEMKDYLEVIRVKNKLNQNTKDIIINFKLKDSFMICQMQLALGKSRQQVNNNFCHNLYQMVRSAFPIIVQHGIRLTHLDPRSQFFKNKHIEFNCKQRFQNLKTNVNVKSNKLYCNNGHENKQFLYVKNNIPFCCYYCASYIKAYSYSIEFVRCPECMQAVCPKCLLDNLKEFQYVYLEKYVSLDELQYFIEQQPFFVGFCSNQKLQKKLKEALAQRSYVFVFQFDRIGLRKNIFKLVNNEITKSFSTLEEIKLRKIRDSQLNWIAIVYPKPITEESLEELKYFSKSTMIDYSYYELNKSLKNHGITQVFAVVNKLMKKALIVDIIESEQEIDLIRRRNDVIRKIQMQNEKEEISIEITNEKLTDLQPLNHIKNKSAVKSMNLSENQIRELKELVQFPNLLELYITQNQVQSLHQIACLNNLQYLNCQMNKLEGQMPILTFQGVRSLDLSHNFITSFSNLSNSSFPHLRALNLNHNKITETAVLNSPNLEILDISSNLIKSIDKLVLSTLPFIRKIDCSNNEIEGQLPLIKSESLEVLRLDHNKLTSVRTLQRAQLPALDVLGLSNNTIQDAIPRIKMPVLEKLDISKNQLRSVQELMLSQLHQLKSLNISNNSIEGELSTIQLHSLRKLNISCNRITSISHLAMSKIDQIEDINLSRNSIVSFPIFEAENLTKFDLSHNCLDCVSNLEQCSLPRLTILDLSSNRIAGAIPVLFMPHLTTINIENNDIIQLMFLEQRQLVPKLATVFVKNNKRLVVKQNSEDGMIRYVKRNSIKSKGNE